MSNRATAITASAIAVMRCWRSWVKIAGIEIEAGDGGVITGIVGCVGAGCAGVTLGSVNGVLVAVGVGVGGLRVGLGTTGLGAV